MATTISEHLLETWIQNLDSEIDRLNYKIW